MGTDNGSHSEANLIYNLYIIKMKQFFDLHNYAINQNVA